MGIYVVFTVLFLLSRIWVVNHWVYCYVWNVAHTARWCNPWRTLAFSRGNGGLLGLTTFWFSSSWILLSGNLSQTLIFTPFPWWQLDCTPLTSGESEGGSKEGTRGRGIWLHQCLVSWVSCFHSKQTGAGSQTEIKLALIVPVFWELLPKSQLGCLSVDQQHSHSQSQWW